MSQGFHELSEVAMFGSIELFLIYTFNKWKAIDFWIYLYLETI